MRFVESLRRAFFLLRRHPKLFFPKLVVAAFYSVTMLWSARLTLALYAPLLAGERLTAAQVTPLAGEAISFGALFLVAYVVDILLSGMYVVLVRDFRAGQTLSFRAAWKASVKKASVILPAEFLAIVVFVAAVYPVQQLAVNAFAKGDSALGTAALALEVVLVFAAVIAFYLLYPVVFLEDTGPVKAIRRGIRLGLRHVRIISKASVVPFAASLLSIGLAFLQHLPAALALFVVARFLIAVLYTYHFVLNPTLYLDYGMRHE